MRIVKVCVALGELIMKNWQEFEIQCTDYLNNKFGHYAKFFHQGGTDSTIPDILVKTNSGNVFYIETKHSPAQCGQFVLLPNLDTGTFEYSKQNTTKLNIYAEKIIDYMNQDFDGFREAGTKGKEIEISNGTTIFTNWIIQHYSAKGVKFFMTNNYTLLPIEHFSDYFEVSAKYRIKRSGSGNVGKSKIHSVMNYITSNDYVITDSYTNGDKLFVYSSHDLHNNRFILRGIEYMFSLRENEYEIRKLSNTYNANVIFSIKQKLTCGMSDEDFICFLT